MGKKENLVIVEEAAGQMLGSTKGLITNMRKGRYASLYFFKKHGWLLVIIIVATVSLMGLRYKTKTKMVEINHLTTELQHSEGIKLREKAKYMSLIRETEMRQRVQQQGLDLEFREQPPYEIH